MTKAEILASAMAAQTTAAFRRGLSFVLDAECEYLRDGVTIRNERVPGDSGGLTFAGIDQKSHPDFPYADPRPSDVWITYRDDYWSPLHCAELPSPVAFVLFAQGVNQGKGAASRMIQFALNDYGSHLTVDGVIGQKTLQSAWKVPDSEGLAMAFLSKSRQRYLKRVAERPDQEKFLNGWLARIEALKRELLA